jgi:hypothetical protein
VLNSTLCQLSSQQDDKMNRHSSSFTIKLLDNFNLWRSLKKTFSPTPPAPWPESQSTNQRQRGTSAPQSPVAVPFQDKQRSFPHISITRFTTTPFAATCHINLLSSTRNLGHKIVNTTRFTCRTLICRFLSSWSSLGSSIKASLLGGSLQRIRWTSSSPIYHGDSGVRNGNEGWSLYMRCMCRESWSHLGNKAAKACTFRTVGKLAR